MTSKGTRPLTGFLFFALIAPLPGANAPRAGAAGQDLITDGIKKVVRDRVDRGECAGMVVAVVHGDGRREYFCYGVKSLKDREAVDEHTLYEIGSITKVFTAILLSHMVLKEEVGLDDPILRHLPAGTKVPCRNGKAITLEHLATHVSGLPRMPSNFAPEDPKNPFADYSVEDLYEFLGYHRLMKETGSHYEYSNLGVGLLGHILALKAGTTYEALTVERICDALKMDSTRITLDEGLRSRLAKGHNALGETPNWDIPTLAGAGALRSSAHDMLTFLEANLGGKKTVLAEAMAMSHKERFKVNDRLRIGLGWHIFVNDTSRILWHNGGTGGYRTFCGFRVGRRIGAVVLANKSWDHDDIGLHLLDETYPIRTSARAVGVKPGAEKVD